MNDIVMFRCSCGKLYMKHEENGHINSKHHQKYINSIDHDCIVATIDDWILVVKEKTIDI